MRASVDVSCTVFGRVEKTAQSSPIPFFIRGEWVLSLERSRSISPNSPNCFKFVVFFMKEESLETLLKTRWYINWRNIRTSPKQLDRRITNLLQLL